jgi:pimeloyl-ACP methyl ester carboxylesterase
MKDNGSTGRAVVMVFLQHNAGAAGLRQADGTAITLMVAKRPAKSDEPLGSLIINPGGPGGSGLVMSAISTRLAWPTTTSSDGILEEWVGPHRSTAGGQADLDRYFAMDSSPDDAAELQARIDEQTDFGRSCLDRSGALLEHISTTDTVRDLDLLRGLVGDAKLNYFGASYGTRIGALYAEMYPQRVGRMILDGAVEVQNQPRRSLRWMASSVRSITSRSGVPKITAGWARSRTT